MIQKVSNAKTIAVMCLAVGVAGCGLNIHRQHGGTAGGASKDSERLAGGATSSMVSPTAMEIVRGMTRAAGIVSTGYVAEFRVFGGGKATAGEEGPIVATHMVLATPLSVYQALMKEDDCEKRSTEKASLLMVLAKNAAMSKQLDELVSQRGSERWCIRLSGSTLAITNLVFDGQVLNMDEVVGQSQFPMDAHTVILPTSLEILSKDK
jgi:hypothetical protein